MLEQRRFVLHVVIWMSPELEALRPIGRNERRSNMVPEIGVEPIRSSLSAGF